ncbi:hypothetical protein COCON_G00013010, partial [Conger conger]
VIGYEYPFICRLGRCTPHLISGDGNFSIFHELYGHKSGISFYYSVSGILCSLSIFCLFQLDLASIQRRTWGGLCSELTKRIETCSLCSSAGTVESLCWNESMGAQFSKTAAKGEVVSEKPGDAAASTSKTNGQENGHVKANGDTSPTAEEAGQEGAQANGSAPAEEGAGQPEVAPAEEGGEGEKVSAEAAPTAEGEAKPEEEAAADGDKKKKKRFSFKKPFKLSGFSFKKTKKEEAEAEDGEEGKGEAEAQEEGATAAAPEAEAAAEAEKPVSEETKPSPAVDEPAAEPKAAEPQVAEPEVAAAEPDPAPSTEETGASPEAAASAE